MFCNKCKKEVPSIKHGPRRYVGALYQMRQCTVCGHTQKAELIKEIGEVK